MWATRNTTVSQASWIILPLVVQERRSRLVVLAAAAHHRAKSSSLTQIAKVAQDLSLVLQPATSNEELTSFRFLRVTPHEVTDLIARGNRRFPTRFTPGPPFRIERTPRSGVIVE